MKSSRLFKYIQNLSVILLSVCITSIIVYGKTKNENAKQVVASALSAMGGEEKIRAIKNTKFEAIGHWNLLEQSERPEGPWIIAYDRISEMRDLVGKRLRQTSEGRVPMSPQPNSLTMIVADGVAAVERNTQMFPFTMAQVQDAEEWLALSPERVLITALDANDLRSEKDATLQGVAHHTVSFTWQGAPVRLFINANTNLPTAVELVRAHPYDTFWSVWGDFTSRTYFSFWTLEKGGLRYPHQWDTERNGQHYRTLTVNKIEFNTEIPANSFDIPENVKTAFETRGKIKVSDWALGLPNQQPQELAKDFIQVRGRWNVAWIKQDDGVVIIEAPISSAYSARVIEEVGKAYPNVPIKAVISTSDAWPHLAGIREYAARGIPIYVLDLNLPIVKRLLSAPFITTPDALAKKQRKADLKIVNGKTVIGSGTNALEIYPIRSESGERMLMIYFPSHRILYGSDLIQPQRDGTFFMPQYLTEISDAAKRENLTIEKVFAMHAPLTPWSDITKAVEKSSAP